MAKSVERGGTVSKQGSTIMTPNGSEAGDKKHERKKPRNTEAYIHVIRKNDGKKKAAKKENGQE
jgi:hypothetical protein